MATPSSLQEPRARHPLLKVALPLAIAACLTITSVVLLVHQSRKLSREESGASAPGAGGKIAAPTVLPIPMGDPSDPHAFEAPAQPPERFGGKYPRWNLKEFPPGWNEAIAESIHRYFEAMELNFEDEQKILALEQVRKDFEEYLASLGPDAIPTLAAILNAEGDFVDRRFLLYALGNLGPRSEEATFVLRDFLMARYQDPRNRSEVGHVIKAMGHLKNETSFDTLTDMIAREDLHSYRPHLIESLGEHPYREEATGTFVESLRSDPLPTVRNKAAQALGKVQSRETLSELYTAFEREPHWVPKQTILGTIGKIGNPNSIPFLEDQARNAKQPAVRLSAAGALRIINTEYARQLLRELGRAEPDAQTRKHIAQFSQEAERKAAGQ
jgi:HEAT repeat protein